MSPLQGSPLSRRLIEPTINEMFGPDTKPSRRMLDLFHQILEYNDGKRVTHKVGRFVNDRYAHRNRWVRAMRQTAVPMRLIDGPVDPNSGGTWPSATSRSSPNPDVVMLDDDIGHWPQIEAPEAVLAHFLAHIDRVTARGVPQPAPRPARARRARAATAARRASRRNPSIDRGARVVGVASPSTAGAPLRG